MKRKIAGALGALSLGGVALLGAGSGAQAADSAKGGATAAGGFQTTATCTSMHLCLYQHDNFGGSKIEIDWNIDVPKLSARGFDNKASSMANLTSLRPVLYQLDGYAGIRYTARESSTDKDFTNNNFDNRASSMHW